MSDIEVTKVLESDATEWQKKLFNLYNPYPLKISFQNQLIQNYGIGARNRFDQLVKEGKGMVPKRAPEIHVTQSLLYRILHCSTTKALKPIRIGVHMIWES